MCHAARPSPTTIWRAQAIALLGSLICAKNTIASSDSQLGCGQRQQLARLRRSNQSAKVFAVVPCLQGLPSLGLSVVWDMVVLGSVRKMTLKHQDPSLRAPSWTEMRKEPGMFHEVLCASKAYNRPANGSCPCTFCC
jgi:hypothetical protein